MGVRLCFFGVRLVATVPLLIGVWLGPCHRQTPTSTCSIARSTRANSLPRNGSTCCEKPRSRGARCGLPPFSLLFNCAQRFEPQTPAHTRTRRGPGFDCKPGVLPASLADWTAIVAIGIMAELSMCVWMYECVDACTVGWRLRWSPKVCASGRLGKGRKWTGAGGRVSPANIPYAVAATASRLFGDAPIV